MSESQSPGLLHAQELPLGPRAALFASPGQIRRQAQSSLHVVRTTHVPLAPHRLQQATESRESFPAAPLDVLDAALALLPGGMLWTHLITMSLVKAHPAVGRPDALRGCRKWGARSNIRHLGEQMSTTGLHIHEFSRGHPRTAQSATSASASSARSRASSSSSDNSVTWAITSSPSSFLASARS